MASASLRGAQAIGTRLDVHLLNPTHGLSQASVGTDSWSCIAPIGSRTSAGTLRSQIRAQQPAGTTPLTEAVQTVAAMIQPKAAMLRARGAAVWWCAQWTGDAAEAHALR